jgi:cyclopropane-fatty-acyl-phospholipid synthase
VENWIDHTPDAGGYDAILSIGAFEHFAKYGLSRTDRVEAYREFFRRCHSWLPRGGRLALQTNVKGNNPRIDRQTARDMLFIINMVFRDSELPRTSEVLEAAEKLFDPVSARNDPDHNARTTQEWHDRLVANRDAAVRLVGESRTADYERYLGSVTEHFRGRHIGLLRIIFEAV